jgi:hypothetical protein
MTKGNRKIGGRNPTMYYAAAVLALVTLMISVNDGLKSSMLSYSMNQASMNDAGALRNEDDFELASRQSFGFFNDVTVKHWNLLKKLVAEHNNHLWPEKPLTHNPDVDKRTIKYRSSYPAWWQTNYEPNFSCQFEQRIGGNGNGDGPKWVCDPHRIARLSAERKAKDPKSPGCVVYSIGSNGHFEFEMGMQDNLGVGTCEFHIFDPGNYTHRMPKELKNTYYHQWGLVKQDDTVGRIPNPDDRWQGLKDIIKLLGHEKLETIDVFKIDCEKCEWKTFGDWFQAGIPNLQQIQVELHGAPAAQVLNFFDSFEEAGYARFHKEPNIQYNDGSCIEYAFLKLDKAFFPAKNTTVAAN